MNDDSWAEGQDGSRVLYRERLLPSAAVWPVALGLVVMLGMAYGAAYGLPLGAALSGLGCALVAAMLVATSPVVRVDDRVFRAGRARLPIERCGDVRVLDREAAARLRGPEADPSAYLLLRTWSSARGLRVGVVDPDDPHPYWLVTSRHPDRVADAIERARARG